jgi:hypothetical protein
MFRANDAVQVLQRCRPGADAVPTKACGAFVSIRADETGSIRTDEAFASTRIAEPFLSTGEVRG